MKKNIGAKPVGYPASYPIAVISGCRITHLCPLKPKGFSKAGNISLAGIHDGRKVKLSSMFTRDQVAIRRKIKHFSELIALPNLIASDDRFIVEEWIDGTAPSRWQRAARDCLKASIRDFVFGAARYKYGSEHECDFDYLNYLDARVAKWHFVEGVADFVERWRDQRSLLRSELRPALSNPDLRLENFVIERKTGRVVLIDNEFLHVGPGGFMDFFNSAIRNEPQKFDVSPEMHLFFKNTLKLRWFGSALITGHPELIQPRMLEWAVD